MDFDTRLEAQLNGLIKEYINKRMDEEIEKRVEQFRKDLISKKDQYLGEVLNGIRTEVEQNVGMINFRIIFENVVKVGNTNEIL